MRPRLRSSISMPAFIRSRSVGTFRKYSGWASAISSASLLRSVESVRTLARDKHVRSKIHDPAKQNGR